MRIDIDGVGIEYTDQGEGRPVVLLHGWPDSGRLWRHQVPALTGAGLRGTGLPDTIGDAQRTAAAATAFLDRV